MSRWRVACDACDAGAWIGERRDDGIDAWCEGCQRPQRLERGARTPAACPECGTPLTVSEPRFEELLGEAQNIAAVAAAWCGDPEPLGALLPERPRLLTDLDPPPPLPSDAAGTREALQALARGQFDRARTALRDAVQRPGSGGRLWRALGIASQRLGDLDAAESAYSRAIDADARDSAARLDRGALRAARGQFAAAREDFIHAGDRREARWNRAALMVIEAIAVTPGLPDAALLDRAREEAGEPSSYWSDHTVGRLFWALLVERALARGTDAAPEASAVACVDERVLRAAEHELEFDTFWDLALVVHGYARLRMRRETGEAAASLAARLLDQLAGEPYATGPASAWIRGAILTAREAVRTARPGDALAALRSIIERPDVRRYRVPCMRCGRGSLGVQDVDEAAGVGGAR